MQPVKQDCFLEEMRYVYDVKTDSNKPRRFPNVASVRRKIRDGFTLRCWFKDWMDEAKEYEVLVNMEFTWTILYRGGKMETMVRATEGEQAKPKGFIKTMKHSERWEWVGKEDMWKFFL